MLPRHQKGFNLYVDGRNFMGVAESLTLPELALQLESWRAAGMDAARQVELGMNELSLSFVLSGYSAEALALFGREGVQITARKAVQRQGEGAVAVVIEMTGRFNTVGRSEVNQGQLNNMNVNVDLTRYVEKDAGVVLVDIDIMNSKRIIGGVDQLADRRAALGL